MTQPKFDSDLYEQVMQLLIQEGSEGAAEVLRVLLNEALKIERSQALSAQPYERSPDRKGHANGFKPKTVESRLGSLRLDIPQVRGDVEYYPSALEKGVRSERALVVSIAEMYVQGISTRKVTQVLEKLCGTQITSTQVSRAAKALDDELEAWRNRPLGKTPYLMLDARYEKVRVDGAVRSCAVLVATGVREDGTRSVLGVSVSMSEAEIHWREFLGSLKERGLHGVTFITSDDHEGLQKAIQSAFQGAAWQRCQTHLQRNAFAYIPKTDMKSQVASDIRDIFNAPDQEEAERRLGIAVEKYRSTAARLAVWMEENIPEGFAIYSLPEPHRKRMRTSNPLERLNKEIKKRTRVATLFPNEDSLLRLVSAILSEISDEWETGKIYLGMKEIG